MGPIRRLIQLPAQDRQLLIQAALLLNGVRLGLWLVSFQRLRQILLKLPSIWPRSHYHAQVSINKIVWAVEVSSRYTPYQAKCLAKALTAQTLLNRWDHRNQLRIGVAKNDQGQLAAHAWIEHQNKILIGNLPDLSDFTPLPNLESAKS